MHVRLVEDRSDLILLLHHILNLRGGADLSVTTNDFDRLFSVESWEGVDVALVDIMLGDPEISGIDVLRFLKQNLPNIRRVVYSAVAHQKEFADLADVVLTKGTGGIAALLTAIGLDPDNPDVDVTPDG